MFKKIVTFGLDILLGILLVMALITALTLVVAMAKLLWAVAALSIVPPHVHF